MKKSAVILTAAVLCVLSAYLGYRLGEIRVSEGDRIRDDYLSTINAAASYSTHADVLEAFHTQKAEKAVCLLNLWASAEVNKVRGCLAREDCKRLVEDKLNEIAPELLKGNTLRIVYYAEGEICKS